MRRTRFGSPLLWFALIIAAASIISFGTHAGSPRPVKPRPLAPAYEGFHDSVDCTQVTGWVWDTNNSATHFDVTVYDGTVPVASGIANQGRPDLHRGTNDYGFFIATPARIKDGLTHSISVKITGTNISLGTTPRTFNSSNPVCSPTSPPPATAYEGFHDSVTCDWIGGWVRDNNNLGAQLTVVAVDETGAVLGTALAFQAYGSAGNHGFFLPVPDRIKDGMTHSVTVKVLNSVFNLVGTPRSFNSVASACPTPTPSPTPPPPPPGQITMTIRTRTSASKNYNFRVQMGNPSISYTPTSSTQPAKYHAYGDSGIDTWRWNTDFAAPAPTPTPAFESNYITQYPIQTNVPNCAYGTDPRLWDARCTSDSLGYFWKQVTCPSPGGSVACQDNDRWNGWPGTFNVSTFSSPNLWPNLYSQGYGTRGFTNIINASKINSVSIQPSAGNCLPTADAVWVDDILPTNAVKDGNEAWKWTYASPAPVIPQGWPSPSPVSPADPKFAPPPFPSVLSHQSSRVAGMHQHYFSNAIPLKVDAGDTLFAYVYIDPNSPPQEIMLQWNDGSWEHRAYWGQNLIGWGTNGTTSRWWMGNVPAAGQWVRLEVPANKVGLEGRMVNGMAFALFDGQATWDRAGKAKAVPSSNCPPKLGVVPFANSFHAYNPDEFATGADYPAVVQVNYGNGSSRWFMAFNKMLKYVTTTYQTQGGPYNNSEYGFTWGDSWQVMWATSPDGANWTVHPQMLLRTVNEAQQPWLGMLVQDMIVDGGYFYLLVQDMTHPYVYLVRAPIDAYSTTGPGYVQNATQGWRIASYPIQANGDYTWNAFPLGVSSDFDQLGAYPVMRSVIDPNLGYVKRSAIGRVFSSTTPGASLYFGVTNDHNILELWRTTSLSKPFNYESNVVIEDPTIIPSGFSFRYGFTHYADNVPGNPRILSSGFDWWMAEDLTGSGPGHTTSPNPQDGYSTAGRHTAQLSGF